MVIAEQNSPIVVIEMWPTETVELWVDGLSETPTGGTVPHCLKPERTNHKAPIRESLKLV